MDKMFKYRESCKEDGKVRGEETQVNQILSSFGVEVNAMEGLLERYCLVSCTKKA